MTLFASLLVASVVIAPADRLAMADRLFNRGEYAAARDEYAVLTGSDRVAADEILFRLAECSRVLGDSAAAREQYAKLLADYPNSVHVGRARLMKALAVSGKARVDELKLLDSDRVDAPTRATALYYIGEATADVDAFERCLNLDPKGRCAPYAKMHAASLISRREDAGERRRAVSMFLDLAFGSDTKLAEEALYLAAAASFSDRRYGEASSLFRRYLRRYPRGAHVARATDSCAWSDYLGGKYADAAATCGEGKSDETAYVLAAVAQATGDLERARTLFRRYLEDYPEGRHRQAVELPLARIDFELAERTGDTAKAVESARRGAGLSGTAADALRLAWAYEKGGRAKEAASEYVAVAERFPGTPEAADALYRKAMGDLRAENWSAAELALKEALAGRLDARRRPEATYWRGIAACRLGHFAEGVSLLRSAVADGLSLDQSREARLTIADIDFNDGRREEALAAYAKLVREGAAERMSAFKALSVGRLLLDSGDAEAARLCARQLQSAERPEWRQGAQALVGDAETRLGNLSAAAQAYRLCLAETCATEVVVPVSLKLARHLLAEGKLEDVEPLLTRAVNLTEDPESRAEAYLSFARLESARGNASAARYYAALLTELYDTTPAARAVQEVLRGLEVRK